MSKKIEKLITVSCSKCFNIFIEKVNLKIGTVESEKSEIDVNCNECGALLTVEIDGRMSLNSISLRQHKGITKTR